MATKAEVRPSDLPTRVYRMDDGTIIRKKVVQSNSPTLGQDLQAAFRSSVRSIRAEQRKRARAEAAE